MLKVEEAARRMNVSRAYVYRLIGEEKLPAYRLRIREEALEKFLQDCRTGTKETAGAPAPRRRLRHIRVSRE